MMLELNYDLYTLPSSQHRAGLAALCLLIPWMKKKGLVQGNLEIQRDSSSATIKLDQEGLRSLLDCFFETLWGESKVRSPFKGETEIRIDEVTDAQGKTIKYYVYPTPEPQGAFLKDWCSSDMWLSQWRKMIWKIVRAIPASRAPYMSRLEKKDTTNDVETLFKNLSKPSGVTTLSGSYALGVAAKNSEGTAFKDRNDNAFLLLFWPLVVDLNIMIKNDVRTGSLSRLGFLIKVPDVCDLQLFCDLFPEIVKSRKQEALRDFYVEIPEEGGALFAAPLGKTISRTKNRSSVFAVDLFHADKVGNSVKIFRIQRYVPTEDAKTLASFLTHTRTEFWVPQIRHAILRNILQAKHPMDGVYEVLHRLGYEKLSGLRYVVHDTKLLLEDFTSDDEKAFVSGVSIHLDYLLRRRGVGTYKSMEESGKLPRYFHELKKVSRHFFNTCEATPEIVFVETLERLLSPHFADRVVPVLNTQPRTKVLTLVLLSTLLRYRPNEDRS